MVRGSNSAMQDDMLISSMLLSVCNLAAMLPEGVSRFRKMMHEYEEFSTKREKTKASMAAMKMEIKGFVEKEKAWVVKVHKLTTMHEIELNNMKKRMEADKLQLKADRDALNVQQKAFLDEKEGLKASLSQATSDNQWLIKHGFHQVVTYLLHSTEFNYALGDVYTKLLNHGKHLGFVAGYKAHESGHPQEQSSFYQPQALAIFKEAILNMEGLTYPYVLKPSGLNEVVCAKVLKSLSKKCSHSGDSEDTFSEIVEGSLEASIEGSEVAGDDGGRKKKKAKRARRLRLLKLRLLSLFLMFKQSIRSYLSTFRQDYVHFYVMGTV
ncbi:hypothetical protein Hanom_Chr16g01451801 [Helianthus anomalus]